jgi:hypothetical protein
LRGRGYCKPSFLHGACVQRERSTVNVDRQRSAVHGERCAHGSKDSSGGWQHAEDGPRPGIHSGRAVHEHLEFAVPAPLHLHVGAKLPPQPGRHTGGVQAGHSIRAVTDSDAAHLWPPLTAVCSRRRPGVFRVYGDRSPLHDWRLMVNGQRDRPGPREPVPLLLPRRALPAGRPCRGCGCE